MASILIRMLLTCAALVGCLFVFGSLLALNGTAAPRPASGLLNFVFFGLFAPAAVVIWRQRGTLLRRFYAYAIGIMTAFGLALSQSFAPLLWFHLTEDVSTSAMLSGTLGGMVTIFPTAIAFAIHSRGSAAKSDSLKSPQKTVPPQLPS
jgi:hypothetical protein